MAVTNYYTIDGQMIGYKDAGGRKDFLTDALGSVTGEVDQTGTNRTFNGRYKPYGGMLWSSGSRGTFGWVGTLGYKSTGLKNSSHYVRARHYSQISGTWTSQDPLWPNEMAYGYVNGQITGMTDPTGTLRGARSTIGPWVGTGRLIGRPGFTNWNYPGWSQFNTDFWGNVTPNPFSPPSYGKPPTIEHIPWDAPNPSPCYSDHTIIAIKDLPSRTLPPWLNPPWIGIDPSNLRNPCKPCPPPPVKYRTDVVPPSKPHHMKIEDMPPGGSPGCCCGTHTHLYFQRQNPINCQCFYVPGPVLCHSGFLQGQDCDRCP